ncbi:MAG TPA: hypothetical protein ENK47_08300 [Euryarchaeota archaeon]|nr:hypothetical protein [Euryarchaeota archaeon]
MDRIELSLDDIRGRMEGGELLLVPAGERDLHETATTVADRLDVDPPVLVERDVLPRAMKEFMVEGKRVLAVMWSMDLEEIGDEIELVAIKRIPFRDPDLVFGAPTLSFISRMGPFWENIPEGARAVYDHRYRKLSEGYIEGLRRGGMDISAHAVKGELYSYLQRGSAELGIGVVRDENMPRDPGAWPLDRIMGGEIIISGPTSIWGPHG